MQQDFEAFYAQARDGCLRAVLVTTIDAHLAEDLVAEAFARAWARWPAVRRHPSPAAWVVRTALNLRVSWWRRRRREVLSDRTEAASPASVSTAHLGGLEDAHGELDLLQLLSRLPERQRQVLALRVFLDLDTRATAQALDIAEGTVTAHLHRATSTLRQLLDAEAPSPPTARGRATTARTPARATLRRNPRATSALPVHPAATVGASDA